jgi:hypothetical protein
MKFKLKALLYLRIKKSVIRGSKFRVATDIIQHNFET